MCKKSSNDFNQVHLHVASERKDANYIFFEDDKKLKDWDEIIYCVLYPIFTWDYIILLQFIFFIDALYRNFIVI